MEYSQAIEIDTGRRVYAMRFTANGEYLVSGGREGVQVWRVKDGECVATMQASDVWSVAVSNDGRFIAAGSVWGHIWVWDAATHSQVFTHIFPGGPTILDVDFSPDSTKLVSANGGDRTATIWDFTAPEQVQTLDYRESIHAAKYSPQGDRIATATDKCVQVWDINDGHLVIDLKEELKPLRGLLWFNDHLFVKTRECEIKQIDASTGITVAKWSVPDGDSVFALPQHGQFLAYSTKDNVILWDTSTHTQLGVIPRSGGGPPVALSPDGQLAIVTQESKITVNDMLFVIEPDICIEGRSLRAWKSGQLTTAEALLTTILRTKDAAHHVFASRALVRARLRQWDAALVDAEKSLEIQSSTFGYIAKFVVLVGKGDTHAVHRLCDIAFLYLRLDHVPILLLIKAVVLFMAREYDDAISRMNDLIAARPLDPTLHIVRSHMLFLHGKLYMERGNYNRAIQSFEDARIKFTNRTERPPLIIALISGWEFDDLAISIQQRSCEALLSAGRLKEAGESALRMIYQGANPIETWVSDFLHRCLSTSEHNNDASITTVAHNNASHPMMALLREWVELKLTTGSWKDALTASTGFALSRFVIYRAICDRLETTDHVTDAVSCFHQSYGELGQEMDSGDAHWTREDRGDIATNNKEYGNAISYYTAALSLDPAIKQILLVKRSAACMAKGEWDNALSDANEAVRLNPNSPSGYERRYAALHCKGDRQDAIIAYETMLLKMSESSDPEIRERSRLYVSPEATRDIIRTTIEDTIRDSPLVLIDTAHGRLCDKLEQASSFQKTSTFTKLVSSMTTHIDHAHIQQEVGGYFRYATFSHRWENNEPLYEKVIKVMVYDLEASPAHEKLKMFCKIVREAGFYWAWSDTCCTNKGDHFILQEALVSMFNWYERSAMTIIHLRGVNRLAPPGALTRSIWNIRAWTLQEYHASKVVQIYTEDWTPYLGLEIYNHKGSPEIISEMEEATGISAQALMALHPGLDDIREKLQLASTRQTTRVEDAAYSLLGIFTLTLPITYGEGDKALGRLLAQLLASSGDMSILAWTGGSGSFNSCLPSSITVFSELPTTHIPPPISDAQIGSITAGFRSLNPTLFTTLYDRVNELLVPSFSGRRMRLPCLAFKVGRVSEVSRNGSERIFRARTNILGIVEIKTNEDLTQLGSLYLAHPWIDFLLDRQPIGSVLEATTEESTDDGKSVLRELPSFPGLSNAASTARPTRTARLMSRIGLPFGGHPTTDAVSLLPPSTLAPVQKQARALRFIARLRQPFGALLLAPTRRNMDEYRRVAAESLITVQVEEIRPAILDKLINSVRMLDVL